MNVRVLWPYCTLVFSFFLFDFFLLFFDCLIRFDLVLHPVITLIGIGGFLRHANSNNGLCADGSFAFQRTQHPAIVFYCKAIQPLHHQSDNRTENDDDDDDQILLINKRLIFSLSFSLSWYIQQVMDIKVTPASEGYSIRKNVVLVNNSLLWSSCTMEKLPQYSPIEHEYQSARFTPKHAMDSLSFLAIGQVLACIYKRR